MSPEHPRHEALPAPHAPAIEPTAALEAARRTLAIEAEALQALAARQGDGFVAAVRALAECRGRVVVMGIGKSGHVGRKIAATLASTGTPSFFVHPAEASHGDLGMVQREDVVLALSNSGEADELAALLPALRRLGCRIVAMTGRPESTLARHADHVLDSHVAQEACPLNLAPTASTTAQIALGDAVAVALLEARGFGQEDFARSHPGGALGRRVLVHVSDVMAQGDALPLVPPDATLVETMRAMSAKGLGCAIVADGSGTLLGMFTDGDLRRMIERGEDLRQRAVGEVMTRSPRTIGTQALAAEAAERMEQGRITSLVVTDAAHKVQGIVTIGQLMRARVV